MPKKIVTFFFPSSPSGSVFTINGGGFGEGTALSALDLRRRKKKTHPIKTAIDVERTMTKSRFSARIAAPESGSMAAGSNLLLTIADVRSNGEIFMVVDCIVSDR